MIGRYLYRSAASRMAGAAANRRQPEMVEGTDRAKRTRDRRREREGNRSDFPISAAGCI